MLIISSIGFGSLSALSVAPWDNMLDWEVPRLMYEAGILRRSASDYFAFLHEIRKRIQSLTWIESKESESLVSAFSKLPNLESLNCEPVPGMLEYKYKHGANTRMQLELARMIRAETIHMNCTNTGARQVSVLYLSKPKPFVNIETVGLLILRPCDDYCANTID